MPVITVEGPGIANLDIRRKLAQDLTEATCRAYGLPKEAIIVILHETSPDCVASGGELICDRQASRTQSTPDDRALSVGKAIAAGNAAAVSDGATRGGN